MHGGLPYSCIAPKRTQLFIQLSKAEADRKRTDYSTRKRVDLAFEAMQDELMQKVKSYPELAMKLRDVLIEARGKVMKDLSD